VIPHLCAVDASYDYLRQDLAASRRRNRYNGPDAYQVNFSDVPSRRQMCRPAA